MGRISNKELSKTVDEDKINRFINSICDKNPKIDEVTVRIFIKAGIIKKQEIKNYMICDSYWEAMKNKAKGVKKMQIIAELSSDFDCSNESILHVIKRYKPLVFVF